MNAPNDIDWRDSFSRAAQDWLTIYSWAVAAGTGEERERVMQRLIIACFRMQGRRTWSKVNLATAERVVAADAARYPKN